MGLRLTTMHKVSVPYMKPSKTSPTLMWARTLSNSRSFVAMTGLGAHAFRSFKSTENAHMWIRDSLPFDLPGARILTYGYDSHLQKSKSFQSITSIANQFLDSLRAIRVGCIVATT